MSYSDDLDWLARNVHEWKEGKIECIPMSPYKVENVVWSSMSPCEGWITKDQWLNRRAELQGKPSWDGDNVPNWAEWLAQDEDGDWKWLGDSPSQYVDGWTAKKLRACCGGNLLGDWRDTLEQRPADMSEAAATDRLKEATQNVLAAVPALKDEKYRFEWELKLVDVYKNQEEIYTSADCWCRTCQPVTITNMRFVVCPECGNKRCPKTNDHRNACTGSNEPGQTGSAYPADTKGQDMDNSTYWHERGELPPVGAECVIWSDGRFPPEECKIVAYSMEQVCVRWNGSGDLDVIDLQFKSPSECKFRPIRTERDEAIEAMKAHCPYPGSWETTYRLFAESLYDAGYRAGGFE